MGEVKKSGRSKRFFKRLGIAALIAAGYGMFYSQVDTGLIKGLSQKKEFVVAIDFEAYNKIEPLGITTDIPIKEEEITTKEEEITKVTEPEEDYYDAQPVEEVTKKKEEPKSLSDKTIENWTYISDYSIMGWVTESYASSLGFTPYYGHLHDDDKTKIAERLEEGDEMLTDLVKSVDKPNFIILRVRGDAKDYEYLKEDDPITFITKRIARNTSDFYYKAIIELEAPDDGDYEAHNARIDFIRKMSPKFKIAATLDKKEGYDEKTGLWDPEKSKQYWENADIIILEDYFSKPGDLEESIKNFKNAVLGGKQIWVRVVVGTERINEMGTKSLEAEIEAYEQVMEVVKEYADGCLVSDTNGIWLYSDDAYDKGERSNRTKLLYKRFRRIKIDM